MTTGSPRIDGVVPGEPLPGFEFDATAAALVAYAGATWDFHRLHHDAAYAASQGLPAPVMDGQMIGALIARLLMQWAGPDAFVRRLSFRLRAPVYSGERIRLAGAVRGTRIDGGQPLVDCTIDVTKADGTRIVVDASATLRLAPA